MSMMSGGPGAPPPPPSTMAGGLARLAEVIERAREIANIVENGADKFCGRSGPLSDGTVGKPSVEPNGAVEALHSMIPTLHQALSRIEDAGRRLHITHD